MSRRLRRTMARVVVGICVVVLLALEIENLREFFVDHRGIEFYRQNPHLLAVSLACGVVIGLCIKLVADWWRPRQPPPGEAGRSAEGQEPRGDSNPP